jgi:hypothetical protein
LSFQLSIRSATRTTASDVSCGTTIFFDSSVAPLVASPSAFVAASPSIELFRRFDFTAIAVTVVDFIVFVAASVVFVGFVTFVASLRIVTSSTIRKFDYTVVSTRFIIVDDFIQQFTHDGRFFVRWKRCKFSRQWIFFFIVTDFIFGVDVSHLFVDYCQLQQRRFFLLSSSQWHPFPR